MTYQQAVDYLYQQLPIFHRQGESAYKPSLNNTLKLAQYFGNPQHGQAYIHVAGTNGKGSVSHMLASIFIEQGYKTGLYTSPHLTDFRERIKINGKEVPKSQVISFVKKAKPIIEQVSPSFFELTVIMAYYLFNINHTDIAIIETGMGGLYDSTNIITPIASVITNISYDHQKFLGNTLSEIAHQKAGIIKNNIPFILGEPNAEILPLFNEHSKNKTAAMFLAEPLQKPPKGLNGDFQFKNIETVVKTIHVINEKTNFNISAASLKSGIENVVINTNFKGRFQVLENNPLIIADVAHNIDGIKTILIEIEKISKKNLNIVFGMLADKERDQIWPLLPKKANYYLAAPNVPRALPVDILIGEAEPYLKNVKSYKSVKEAFKAAKIQATENDLILIFGSFFVVSEVLQLYK